MMTPRGIRLHNPGNIRLGIKWDGLAEIQRDESFSTFDGPEWGIRAVCRVLMTYERKYNIGTIRGIVSRWAPDCENDTESYIKNVSAWSGFGPSVPLDMQDPGVLSIIAKCLTRQENGQYFYTDDIFSKGALMAKGVYE